MMVAVCWEQKPKNQASKEFDEALRRKLEYDVDNNPNIRLLERHGKEQRVPQPLVLQANTLVGLWSCAPRDVSGHLFFETRDGYIQRQVMVFSSRQFRRSKYQGLFASFYLEPIDGLVYTGDQGERKSKLFRYGDTEATLLHRWKTIFRLHSEFPDMIKALGYEWQYFEIPAAEPDPSPESSTKLLALMSNTKNSRVSPAMKNFSSPVYTGGRYHPGHVANAIFCLCALVYGGVHARAWIDQFPSSFEQRLWRVASVYLAAFGVTFMLLCLLLRVKALIAERTAKRTRASLVPTVTSSSGLRHVYQYVGRYDKWLFGMGLTLGAMFCLCRAYLVAEAFLSLRQLPADAYLTPTWSQYLPHF